MKKAVILVLIFYFIQGFVHNLGHPVTPSFVNALGIEARMFGFFFSFMSLGLMVGAPLWGVLGDARQKKAFIVIGLLLYSLGQWLFGASSNPWLMTSFRFLSGFGVSASVTLLLAHLISIVPKESRTKYLSLSAALLALGSTFGYQVGGILGGYFLREVFYIQAILNVVYVLIILVFLKEAQATRTQTTHFFHQVKMATKLSPTLLMFLVGLTLATMSMTIVTKYLDVYIIDSGYTTRQLGTFVMVTGLVGLFTNFVIVPYLSRFRKELFIMKHLQWLSALLIFIVFRGNNLMIMLYSFYMLYVVLRSVFQPFEQNYISLNADERTYSSVMGVRQMFFSIGMVLGPLVAGFVYEQTPRLVFDFSVVIFLLAFVLITLSQRSLLHQKAPKEADDVIVTQLETQDYPASS